MKKWLIWGGATLGVVLAALIGAGMYISRHFEPFVREQTVRYLEDRFGSGVELASLKISPPVIRPWRWREGVLRISGEGLKLRFHDRADLPPLISVRKFDLQTNAGAIWDEPRRVRMIRLEGLDINIPPKDARGGMRRARTGDGPEITVVVDSIDATDTALRLYPKDRAKPPRLFDIHSLKLKGLGAGRAMQYHAKLTNPLPEGEIDAKGEFGPWNRDEPSDTPISGVYEFAKADMGVFKGIDGTLDSTGRFEGVLERILVKGEARVPDFSLRISGNRVPLSTQFESIVDGTSGDTLLVPVRATLGRTSFTAKGGIVRHEGDKGRTIDLDVAMPSGHIQDLLRLAVKGRPFMSGAIVLRTKLLIPPGDADISEKLELQGTFDIDRGNFAKDSIQDKLDELSRRAMGQPKNTQIDDVLAGMAGDFRMSGGRIAFKSLHFQVPGAVIQLAGKYGVTDESVDFHGQARLQAKVSQTMTGWKRWALKPVDPFFSKKGAGTLLPIKVTGTRDNVDFGLDR